LPRPPLLPTAHRIHLDKIGEDIVNSISVHKLPAHDGGPDEIVAVLTNNDKTVRIYSLLHNTELAVLDLPVAMNHATISPDGQMLVAVGDQQSGFFFESIYTRKPSSAKIPDARIQSVPPIWQLYDEVSLYLPARQCAEGYFTTAWSSTGRLCAVGSECGYITVFDMDLLRLVEDGEDAIVQVISSTRPDVTTGAGAVRTMQFSPAPWDFLIWSEDQGRVCVADLRSGLKVKQVLTLDSKDKDVERIEIADFELAISPEMHELRREADFLRRYRRALDSEGTAAAVNAANEYFEADSERQQLHRRLGVVESDNDPHGLTARERQVLEALRTNRQREEAREPGTRPHSINYTTAGHMDTARYQARTPFSHGLPADILLRERASAGRDVPDFSDLLSEDLRQINRALQQRRAPRRQAAVIVSIDEGTINAPPHAHGNITDSATTQSPSTVPAQARRVTNDILTSTEDAWRTIEEALASQARAANSAGRAAISNPNNPNTTTPTGAELRSEVRRLRQMSQMRERLRNARASQPTTETYEFSLGLRRSSRSTHDPAQGLRTAGRAMSQDGRTQYCGTEEGIFEFKMNLHARKGFPAMMPR
jgi:hypothetical protein